MSAIIALVARLGTTAVDLYCANRLSEERARPPAPVRDYRDRSGWPRRVEAMRGAAREDGFEIPDDMRGPPALRPYGDGSEARSTAAAAVLVWLLAVEGLIADLLHRAAFTQWLPAAAGRALVHAGSGGDGLAVPAAAAVFTLYVAGLAGAGTRITLQRDIN